MMGITIYSELIQGSDEWRDARCGLLTASEMGLIVTPTLLTASEMGLIVTPTLKAASNDKERAHLYELLAQRITGHVEPQYVSDAMLRGQDDEIEAVMLYAKTYAEVEHIGFMTNDKWGFTIGYSPDALVGENGLVECKSRSQKWQIRTLTEFVPNEAIDPDFMIQCQTGLLVSERDWVDLVSYCGGLPMATVRVFQDAKVQEAIINAVIAFENKLHDRLATYNAIMKSKARLIPTERKIYQEIF